MRYPVQRKQPNSRMCHVCGLENPQGLHAAFYEVHGGLLVASFAPRAEQQGYPGRLHGGVASCLLDETLGRTIMIHEPEAYWGVTIDLKLRYRQPIPLDAPVRAVAQFTSDSKRFFEAKGRIYLPDGTTAVEAEGRFMKLELQRIADFDVHQQAWTVSPLPSDPLEFEF